MGLNKIMIEFNSLKYKLKNKLKKIGFIDVDLIVNDAFKSIVGRDVDVDSLIYWKDKLSTGEQTVEHFLSFIRSSEEALNRVAGINDAYFLKLLYEKSQLGSASGDPYYLNTSCKNVYFLHIPKAAGISLTHYLAQDYHPLQIQSLTFGEGSNASYKRFFAGHFSMNEMPKNENIVKVISIRDPKQRIVSLYKFLVAVPDKNPIWGAAAKAARQCTLSEFLSIKDINISFVFDNYYVRALSGAGIPFGDLEHIVGFDELKLAEINLSSFDHIITTESLQANQGISDVLADRLRSSLQARLSIPIGLLNQGRIDSSLNEGLVPDELVALDYQLLNRFYSGA
jgi:hypothetical protein